MFTDIRNLLNTPDKSLNDCCFVGICEKGADSSFLVHHFLSYFLKQDCNVVLVSLSQSFNHFNGVGNKIGNNLNHAREQNRLLFINGLKELTDALGCVSASVSKEVLWKSCVTASGDIDGVAMYKILRQQIEAFTEKNKKTVVVIDNISTLLDIGMPTKALTLLIQYLNIYLREKGSCSLVLGCENNLGQEDEDGNMLANLIKHIADLSLEVKGLVTGYCRDVHGQIAVTWHSRMSIEKSLTKTTQYKLTDKTCAVFAAGMSSAVL